MRRLRSSSVESKGMLMSRALMSAPMVPLKQGTLQLLSLMTTLTSRPVGQHL